MKAGSCAGFKNSTGITNSTITIANVSDISGPVPGLFKSAPGRDRPTSRTSTRTSSICGRKLKLETLDSRTSEGGDQQAASTACGNAFAMVGSMGAFDAGGAGTVAQVRHARHPRGTSTETPRYRSPVSFGAYSLASAGHPGRAVQLLQVAGRQRTRTRRFVYLNAGVGLAEREELHGRRAKLGYNFDNSAGIDVTTFPYDSYVQSMSDKGVQYVQYIGAYQYAVRAEEAIEARRSSSFNPIFVMDPIAYDQGFVQSGGQRGQRHVHLRRRAAVRGGRPQSRAGDLPAVAQRTSGGDADVLRHLRLGGGRAVRAARRAARRQADPGIAAVGRCGACTTARTTRCSRRNTSARRSRPTACRSIQLNGGKWVRKTPYPYTCGAIIDSGTG